MHKPKCIQQNLSMLLQILNLVNVLDDYQTINYLVLVIIPAGLKKNFLLNQDKDMISILWHWQLAQDIRRVSCLAVYMFVLVFFCLWFHSFYRLCFNSRASSIRFWIIIIKVVRITESCRHTTVNNVRHDIMIRKVVWHLRC